MDLYAYAQIDDINKIAKDNGIEVPRLRGYRLMSDETAITKDEIRRVIQDMNVKVFESAVMSVPSFCPDSCIHEYSSRTDRLKKKYLITRKTGDNEYLSEETVGIRWNLIHGKKRKNLKFALKKQRKAIEKNVAAFNRYVGCDDVLYIHARIGGDNWLDFGGAQLEKQPWFLEKVDDYFDSTYCDIYAKINVSNS